MSLMEIRCQYPYDTKELTMQVDVVHGDYPKNKRAIKCKAIWDTGASDTTIATNIVRAIGLRRLNLPPRLTHTANGDYLSYAYEACLSLSKDYPPFKMKVYEIPPSDIDVLIGMDIIRLGRFEIAPSKEKLDLTFEIAKKE